jgi:hypothetical protein
MELKNKGEAYRVGELNKHFSKTEVYICELLLSYYAQPLKTRDIYGRFDYAEVLS